MAFDPCKITESEQIVKWGMEYLTSPCGSDIRRGGDGAWRRVNKQCCDENFNNSRGGPCLYRFRPEPDEIFKYINPIIADSTPVGGGRWNPFGLPGGDEARKKIIVALITDPVGGSAEYVRTNRDTGCKEVLVANHGRGRIYKTGESPEAFGEWTHMAVADCPPPPSVVTGAVFTANNCASLVHNGKAGIICKPHKDAAQYWDYEFPEDRFGVSQGVGFIYGDEIYDPRNWHIQYYNEPQWRWSEGGVLDECLKSYMSKYHAGLTNEKHKQLSLPGCIKNKHWMTTTVNKLFDLYTNNYTGTSDCYYYIRIVNVDVTYTDDDPTKQATGVTIEWQWCKSCAATAPCPSDVPWHPNKITLSLDCTDGTDVVGGDGSSVNDPSWATLDPHKPGGEPIPANDRVAIPQVFVRELENGIYVKFRSNIEWATWFEDYDADGGTSPDEPTGASDDPAFEGGNRFPESKSLRYDMPWNFGPWRAQRKRWGRIVPDKHNTGRCKGVIPTGTRGVGETCGCPKSFEEQWHKNSGECDFCRSYCCSYTDFPDTPGDNHDFTDDGWTAIKPFFGKEYKVVCTCLDHKARSTDCGCDDPDDDSDNIHTDDTNTTMLDELEATAAAMQDTIVIRWSSTDVDIDHVIVRFNSGVGATYPATSSDGTGFTPSAYAGEAANHMSLGFDTTYYYRAWAVDAEGNVSSGSSFATATTESEP